MEPFPELDLTYIDPEWEVDPPNSPPQHASPLPPFLALSPPPPPPPPSVPYRYPSPLQVSSSGEQLDDNHYKNALEKGSYRLISTDPTLRWSYWVHWEPVNKSGSKIELEAKMTWTGSFDMLPLPELPVRYAAVGLGRLRELYKDRAIPPSILNRLTPDDGRKSPAVQQWGASTSINSQSVQTGYDALGSEDDPTVGSCVDKFANEHSADPYRFDTKPENMEVPYSVSGSIHSSEAPSAPPAPTI